MGFLKRIFGEQKDGEVKFVRKYSETKREPITGATGVMHYEIYKARTAEAARAFLAGKMVSERLHYLVVETPEGNWGRDINGIYKE
jgi:hypothetical protein